MRTNIHVYAGTAGHSAWFSEDAGQTWVHPNSHSGMYLEARVWCLSSHPAMPEHVFAGTDMGVYRWDEAPARWVALPSPMADVWALAQDPSDARVLIAGTRPAGFFRSTDAGQHWQALQAPGISQFSDINMGPTRVTQILFDPVTPGMVWATVEIGGIYRSADHGQTWQLLDQGLVSADVHGIAVVPCPGGGDSWVYATTNRGLHRSTDQGQNWVFQELKTPWQYTRTVMPRLDNPAIVFLTNGNGPPGNDGKLLRSHNHGQDWQEVQLPGEINSTVWCVAMNPSDPQLIFLCTNLGQLFRSTDGGEHFERLPHEFGELRALHWRALPEGARQAPHAITRPQIKARELAAMGT